MSDNTFNKTHLDFQKVKDVNSPKGVTLLSKVISHIYNLHNCFSCCSITCMSLSRCVCIVRGVEVEVEQALFVAIFDNKFVLSILEEVGYYSGRGFVSYANRLHFKST
uniref:Uncharacterized protein n=1 Tax=Panagrellus redivivus TaxID=6233 RepID=A0A7E4UWK0_PANRE